MSVSEVVLGEDQGRTKKLKVLQVITRGDDLGGAQVHVRELSVALRGAGVAVSVLAGGEGPLVDQLRSRGIPVRVLQHLRRAIRPLTDLRALGELRSAVADLAPDLVACHSSKAGWLGRIAARLAGVPAVFTAHGWAFTEGVAALPRALYRGAERLAAPLASRIITVSEYDRSLALRSGVGRPEQLVTVHNGLDDVAPEHLADPGLGPVRLMMIARFAPPKDPFTLLTAMSRMPDQEWELQFVGEGPDLQRASEMTSQFGLSGRVRLLGFQAEVAPLLAGVSGLVLSSRFEGLPLTVIEGMRAGLPVVASRVGGVPELVEDGVSGLLVPPGDVDGLARALQRLIDSAELRQRMGAAGRARYLAGFTLEEMTQRTLAVYRAALGQK